jgi:hypothetical protein
MMNRISKTRQAGKSTKSREYGIAARVSIRDRGEKRRSAHDELGRKGL